MLRVAVLQLPGMLETSVSLSFDVLRTASRVAGARGQPPPFVVAPAGGPGEPPGLLVVPGLGCASADELEATLATPAVQAGVAVVAAARAAGAWLASSCAGVALLAEAGALDGRRVTTSWFLGPAMARRYPRVRFVDGAMLVEDGRCVTGGAALAHGEVMLALTRRFVGPEVADLCARYLLLDERRSQQPYVAIAALVLGDAQLAAADAWIRARVGEAFTLDALAAAVGSTPWTLARRFQRVCGLSPSRYVQQVRAEEARRRLAQGARFDEAAYAVGFADSSALRRLLRRLEGGDGSVSPGAG